MLVNLFLFNITPSRMLSQRKHMLKPSLTSLTLWNLKLLLFFFFRRLFYLVIILIFLYFLFTFIFHFNIITFITCFALGTFLTFNIFIRGLPLTLFDVRIIQTHAVLELITMLAQEWLFLVTLMVEMYVLVQTSFAF